MAPTLSNSGASRIPGAVHTLIGKAMGVIIEREGVNETEAFEMLKTMSQHRNVKLRDVAARLAEEAQPPGAEEPENPE
ncbi:MAG: ANTAR domain-containing protein [Actinomycetota bacterium]|nr:ANTAR domain-containing protein [Actinomycetota bacterium]